MADITSGFEAIAGGSARLLILGTLPSRKSLEAGEYYGHPRNAFWPIMASLFGSSTSLSYEARKAALIQNDVAVWDVLAASVRPGSLDASIDTASARANDFNGFFDLHPDIIALCFNGKSAATLFHRLVAPHLEKSSNSLEFHVLPSTSPAHAAMSYQQKLRRWRIITEWLAGEKSH
jgi:hypoxanthine-DNA glycosylase